LTRTRHRTADGRWIWDNAFRPNPAVSTIDAFSVDGSAVDGKHVDLIHTLSSSRSDYSILEREIGRPIAAIRRNRCHEAAKVKSPMSMEALS
jgi:hypothetical protein